MTFSHNSNRAVLINQEGFVRFWDLSGDIPHELSPFDPTTGSRSPSWVWRPMLQPASGRLLLPRHEVYSGVYSRNQLWDLTGIAPRPFPNDQTFFDQDRLGMALPAGLDQFVVVTPDHDQRSRRYRFDGTAWQPQGEPFGDPNVAGESSADGRLFVTVQSATPDQLVGWDLTTDPPIQKWSWSLPLGEHKASSRLTQPLTLAANQRLLAVLRPSKNGQNEDQPGAELI